MKIFVSIPNNSEIQKTFLTEKARQYMEERAEVIYSPFNRHLTIEELPFYATDADVIMTCWNHPYITAASLENTSVKIIAHTGGTVKSLVSPEVFDKGIKVISGNNLYADSVAEGVLSYLLLALRRLPDYVFTLRNGGWELPDKDAFTEGLYDQTVGIVGMGAISQRIIKLLHPFHVNLKVYSGYPIPEDFLQQNNAVQASLEEIFSTCKIVSLHSANTARTAGMIGKEHFDLLQDNAIFINTARGEIVRETEMIEALKENRFRAVLDVFCTEPLEIDSTLRNLPNVYCIPHKAGPTIDRRPLVTMRLVDDIIRFSKGQTMTLEISKAHAARMSTV